MTPDIERIAKEAGVGELIDFTSDHGSCAPFWEITPEQLAKFAALIAEECAKTCEAEGVPVSGVWLPERDFQRKYAAGIRSKFALSNDKPEAK